MDGDFDPDISCLNEYCERRMEIIIEIAAYHSIEGTADEKKDKVKSLIISMMFGGRYISW